MSDELRELKLLRRWANEAVACINRGVAIAHAAGKLGEWEGVRYTLETLYSLDMYDTPAYDAYEAAQAQQEDSHE